ncbi:uncharacterized protein BYT42DRAFT_88315 [Radiomyces spectabilis]|uniref:uncharacterized protein n=1 Tax=Radiomyces spectabilis TaxID=64574 RepID=UPI00221F48C9|nr:uncharacterized protein BYT42DRAFT_88315 [Radiomyces spectabilis]KAI8370428.1 hypothetical protein BYT42DRAFT_88315 [Radiomyces spectabilis]
MITWIPFLRPSSPLTTPFWERNEWFRRHGYQRPWDTYLVLQWICSFALDLVFFKFLVVFVTDVDAKETKYVLHHWDAQERQDTDQPWNLQGLWNGHIMVFISVAIKALSIITSFVSTEDPVVANQRHQVPRSKTYVRRYGTPVIDSFTGVCGICRIKVDQTTRHCKLCNKCVGGMDHHCKWLNCCIGQTNYK